MTRPIGAATLAALEQSPAMPIYFLELQVSPVERYHSALGTINWGGNDWTGVGDIYSLETVTENNALSPQPLRMGLSGLSAAVTRVVFQTQWYQRGCILYIGALNGGNTLVETPSVIFNGVIQDLNLTMADAAGDQVALTAESELIFFKRSRNVRYTNPQLQSEFPGDVGLEFLESVANNRVVWRGRTNQLGGAAGQGTGDEGGGRDRGVSIETFR